MTTRTPSKPLTDLVVFSDLDGTLLSHYGYDVAPAAAGLAALSARGVPLVPATSKTRTETARWQEALKLAGPCISENGGALWIPQGWLPVRPDDAEDAGDQWRIGFGTGIEVVRAALPGIAAAIGVPLRGFGEMSVEEVAARTGLPPEAARDALARDHDEPFVPARPLTADEERRLDGLAEAEGLEITRGGRFHHLLGRCSKGRAARRLLALLGNPPSIGVGDARNDLDLLEATDDAIVVARPDGSHDPALRAALPRARFTEGVGPAGFSEGILAVLRGREP